GPAGPPGAGMVRGAAWRAPATSNTGGSVELANGTPRLTRAMMQRWPESVARGVQGRSTTAVEYAWTVTQSPGIASAVTGVKPVDGFATNASTYASTAGMPPPFVTTTRTWLSSSGTATPPTAPPGCTMRTSGLSLELGEAVSGSDPSSAGWVRM